MPKNGAPRWSFNYIGRRVHDPTPDVLLLGTYDHPNSGKELVGGINLHYLNRKQVEQLRKALPRIMSGRDLKQRHNIGQAALPGIFDNFYRTYDSAEISAVQPSELANWDGGKGGGKMQRQMDRRAASRFKSDTQAKGLPLPPERPVQQPGQQMPQRPPEPAVGQTKPIQRQPMQATPQQAPAKQDLVAQQATSKGELAAIARQYKQRAAQINAINKQEAAAQAQAKAQAQFEKERQENAAELARPDDGQDPLGAQFESISYWNSSKGKQITERIRVS